MIPVGSIPLTIGFLVNGATVFGFLLLPRLSHRLTGPSLSGLQSLWFIVFLFTPGVFGPLEQVTSARVAGANARGESDVGTIHRSIRTTLNLIGATAALLAIAAPLLLRRAFDGNAALLVTLMVAVAGNGLLFCLEGVLSGRRRFGIYATAVGFEGLIRFVACAVLVAMGVHAVSAYATLVALTPWATLAAVLVRDRSIRSTLAGRPRRPKTMPSAGLPTAPAPRAEPSFARAVTQVLGGQLALQAMLNIAPIAATILATRRADKAKVADFGTAFLVSRVPLFLFQALGVALLAEMAGLHAAGDDARIRALLRRLLTALVGVGVAATLAVFVVGDVLSDRLLGTHDLVGRSTWAALFAANAVGLIALTLSAESLARSRYARYGLSWLIGTMAAALTTALVDGVVTRVTAGYVVGMATTVVSLVLLSRWRSGSAPEPRARPETRINNFD